MIETLQFWQMPSGSLKARIKRCRCKKRLFGKATECNKCHKERFEANKKYNERKSKQPRN